MNEAVEVVPEFHIAQIFLRSWQATEKLLQCTWREQQHAKTSVAGFICLTPSNWLPLKFAAGRTPTAPATVILWSSSAPGPSASPLGAMRGKQRRGRCICHCCMIMLLNTCQIPVLMLPLNTSRGWTVFGQPLCLASNVTYSQHIRLLFLLSMYKCFLLWKKIIFYYYKNCTSLPVVSLCPPIPLGAVPLIAHSFIAHTHTSIVTSARKVKVQVLNGSPGRQPDDHTVTRGHRLHVRPYNNTSLVGSMQFYGGCMPYIALHYIAQ